MDFETIPAKELNHIVREGRAVIIDLRTQEEYRKAHIKDAVNIPYETIQETFPYGKERELVLYCGRGSTSMAAARELAEKGYRVKSVVGGLAAYRGPYIVAPVQP